MRYTAWLIVLAVGLPSSAQDLKKQDPAQAHPKVDQKRVDEAIKKGVAFLRTQAITSTWKHSTWEMRYTELVLWTFVHAGVKEDDPDFQKLFKIMMDSKLERTYLVSLQAMILEELDRVKYQWRLAQCGQFLADNQCKNGQWTYGDPSIYVEDIPSETGTGKRQDVATGGGANNAPVKPKEYDPSVPRNKREKPKVTKKIPIKKKRDGPDAGDNSNSQYAALGLRACHDAGIVFETNFLKLSQQWWRRSQKKNPSKDPKPDAVKTGAAVAARALGWCYGDHAHNAYGSMTAGALGSLVMYDYMLAQNWKNDKDVLEGVQWIMENFSVTENVGPPEHADGNKNWMYYYYMYALERAGILYATESFGSHEWYPEGANVLLDAQQSNGCWTAKEHGNAITDTCFAILFLRRATRPLEDVATGDTRKK